jgi:anthraniloyl-CoA monooxygenase
MKQANPAHEVTVVERNKPYDTFGWGVVFSDATMDNMRVWDPETAGEIEQAFNHWDDIELHFKGEVIRSGGHGFVGIGRKKLLNILQRRCERLGVKLVFETDAESDTHYPDADLIIASDGINSRIRTKYEDVFRPTSWCAPTASSGWAPTELYDAFTFDFSRRPSMAGSRPISTSSTKTPPPSSSSARSTSGSSPRPGPGGPGRIHRVLREVLCRQPARRTSP